MTARYGFKRAAQLPKSLDAQAVGERLEGLRRQNAGRLTPEQIVEDARGPSAPHHGAFEWDDAVAAEAHRVDQARHLIRSIVVTVVARDKPVTTRAFVCVQRDDDPERSYTSIEAVLQDPSLRTQALQRAMRELHVWKQRYQEYEELSDIFAAIDRAGEMVA